MPRRDLRILLLLAALALCLALVQTAVDLHTGALFMAPALLLFLPLIAGRRYVGEGCLARLAQRVPQRRRAPAAAGLPRAERRAYLPRGGRLLAFSLAVRPPPGLAITH